MSLERYIFKRKIVHILALLPLLIATSLTLPLAINMIYRSFNVEVFSPEHPELLIGVLLPISFFVARLMLSITHLNTNAFSAIDPFYLSEYIDPTLLTVSDKIKNKLRIKQHIETFVTFDPRLIAVSASGFFEGHVTLNKRFTNRFPSITGGVIAHELAHVVFNSIVWKNFVEFLTVTTTIYLYFANIISLAASLYQHSPVIAALFYIFSLRILIKVFKMDLNPITYLANIYSRSTEYSCDGVATVLGYGDDLLFFLKNLGVSSGRSLLDVLRSTHPSDRRRLRYINSLMKELD